MSLPSSETSMNAGANKSSVRASMNSRMGPGKSAIVFLHHFLGQSQKCIFDSVPGLGAGINYLPVFLLDCRPLTIINLPHVSKIRFVQEQKKRHWSKRLLRAQLER